MQKKCKNTLRANCPAKLMGPQQVQGGDAPGKDCHEQIDASSIHCNLWGWASMITGCDLLSLFALRRSRWQALVYICKRRARQDPALVNHPAHILRRFHSPSLGCRVPQRFHILFLVPLRRDHRQARPLLKLNHIPDNRKSDWVLKGQFLLLQDVHVWVHLQVGRMVKFKATKSFQE